MNIVDGIVLAALLAAVVIGYRRGLIVQLVSLLSVIAAWMVAYLYCGKLTELLRPILPLKWLTEGRSVPLIGSGERLETFIANALSFALLFAAVKIGLSFAGRVMDLMSKVPGINMTNRLGGAALAAVEAALVLFAAILLLEALPTGKVGATVAESRTVQFVHERMPVLTDKLQQLWSRK